MERSRLFAIMSPSASSANAYSQTMAQMEESSSALQAQPCQRRLQNTRCGQNTKSAECGRKLHVLDAMPQSALKLCMQTQHNAESDFNGRLKSHSKSKPCKMHTQMQTYNAESAECRRKLQILNAMPQPEIRVHSDSKCRHSGMQSQTSKCRLSLKK